MKGELQQTGAERGAVLRDYLRVLAR
ncbi:MAG: hypothetical protein QOH23_1921, partial [Gaiellaceae bacterium]|nr:hypothetical protein [Gaiellaceae bacterium]